MSQVLDRVATLISFWWETATPEQFMGVALTIVILGWFVSKSAS